MFVRGGSGRPRCRKSGTSKQKSGRAVLRSNGNGPKCKESSAGGPLPRQARLRRDKKLPKRVWSSASRIASRHTKLRAKGTGPGCVDSVTSSKDTEPEQFSPRADTNSPGLTKLRAERGNPSRVNSEAKSGASSLERERKGTGTSSWTGSSASSMTSKQETPSNSMGKPRLLSARSDKELPECRKSKTGTADSSWERLRSGVGTPMPAKSITRTHESRRKWLLGSSSSPGCTKSGASMENPSQAIPQTSGVEPR